MLVDTGSTYSYISKQFFEQIKKLDCEIKKPNNDKLIVANGQKLQIIGQVLIPIEVGHIKKYLLFRLVPELRSIGILGTDMMERLGLKLDFEKKIWWLPEKPQIKYKIEANPKENRVIWNEDEKEREPRKDSLEEEIDKMLEEDLIEPSNNDWSNPVVKIKKPNRKYRFCLDFIKVNKMTKKDLYPIPIMAEILDALRSAKYVSKIDLRSAYHQIALEEESRKNNSIHSTRKRNVLI